MADTHPNANTPIVILPSSWRARVRDAREEERVRQLIRDEVLVKRHEPYYQVRASIKSAAEGTNRIIAYLLRANTYTADVIEITVGEGYGLTKIREGAEIADEDEDNLAVFEFTAAYADVDFVVATPVPDIPTALNAVNNIAQIGEAAGLRVRKLIGPEATVAAYQSALSSGIRAFFNVGHGYTGGIVLYDGNLTHTWFNGLAGRPVSPAVVYFNSCQVFNPPLQPAVMASGARTFAGGIINLLIGPSEQVATCFWQKTLRDQTAMGTALQTCEQANYPTPGAHGISGDLGPFGVVTIKEVRKDPISDTIKEVRKEPIRDTVKEIRKDPISDTVKEVRKEPVRDTIKEVAGDPTIAETVVPPGPGPVQQGAAMPFVMAGSSQFGGGGEQNVSAAAATDVQALAEAIVAVEQQYNELLAAYDAALRAAGGGTG